MSDLNSPAMQKPGDLYISVFHSLEEQIAVIDKAGNILDVNRAWQNFGGENGLPSGYTWPDHNYLEILSDSVASGDGLAGEALEGITDVLNGKRMFFCCDYPCHSPDKKRWFTMRANPLHGDESRSLFVISHHDITQRKLAEERAEKLAMQDPLTGLANRRAFLLFLSREMRSSIRSRTPISLLLFDVDYFKSYNDEVGHAAGDRCLTNIGQVVLDHARRPLDLAARIGGDEFALILGNTELEMARKIGESVLTKIKDLKIVFGKSKQVTASAGLASMIPDEQQNEDFLFHEADKALYRAKSAGRNQVLHV